ncbi:MAG: hypothetical protein HOC23_15180 [Halieaceae bacterium]|nr:hypothetical protein [Halieaceae bacterium]
MTTYTSNDRLGLLMQALQRMKIKLGVDMQEALLQVNRGQRLRTGLNVCQANVMLADNNNNIVYVNSSLQNMFATAEADIKSELPEFRARDLVGLNMDVFHKNPAHQRQVVKNLTGPHDVEVNVGARTIRILSTPIIDEEKKRLGTVVEWQDRTAEIAMEREIDMVVDAAARGDFSNAIQCTGKTGFFLALSENLNQMSQTIESALNDVMRMLNAMVNGDLSERVSQDYEGAFGQLKNDANKTAEKLASVVESIHGGAQSVAGAAGQIASGNDELSQRTEQQASALEQTAAAMEQMTSTVQQTSENAQSANTLASNSRVQAESGGEVVGQAVDAMSKINATSDEIAKIIGVIDEIAFQTNLLALNAAVEAARAGDQGRGFAVVASEVRNLAGRSAEAAKAIKKLITDSQGAVTRGSDLVNRSGEALQEIVSSVKKVTDLMAEMAVASKEQAMGIEQVNDAITNMEEAVQHNSSIVQETAAASSSMNDLAAGLSQQVSFFNVNR